MRPYIIPLLMSLSFLTGCSFLDDQSTNTEGWSVNKFYTEAKRTLDDKDYQGAIDLYEQMLARYPFGVYAQQAQIDLIYAYYRFDEGASSLASADRFIKVYPQHPHIDYVYYIKGLVNFNEGKDLISYYLPQDPTQRDPGAARQSFEDFAVLLRKFPKSKYAKDARQRMIFLRNNLAAYEIHVANYYINRNAYIAAANRGKYVVENYQHTPSVPDALGVMVTAYRKLGLDDLAQDALRVLKHNYPEHPLAKGIASK